MNITRETALHQDDWWLRSQDRRGGYFNEAEFLWRYDRFQRYVLTIVNVPDWTLDLLFRFCRTVGGYRRVREREFDALSRSTLRFCAISYAPAHSSVNHPKSA